MDYTDIQKLEEVEATRLDFKEKVELTKAKSWLKTVVAFANMDGGHIVFGVTDDHKFVGLENPQEASSKISEKIVSMVSPNPLFTLTQIGGLPKGVVCIDLKVEAGPDYPYRYVNSQSRQAFVRRGDRSEKASDVELNALILRGQNRTYDALPSSYKLSDVSFTLLAATFKKMTGDDFDMAKDLESMGLVDSSGRVTNAGLLMCDQGYLRQSVVVCTRWKGLEKGSVDGDALDDKEYRDASLITLLSNAEDFIRTNSKNRWTIRGMVREEKSDYPFKAVREVLVNALIHRNYQILGTEIHVDIFDDRMEIMSPGGMMSGSRIQNMNKEHIPSMRRNEKISDIFGRLGFMDRRGSGIQRILNSYKNYSQEPTFYSDENIFLVTMPNRSFTGSKYSMSAHKDKAQYIDKSPLTYTVKVQHVDRSPLTYTDKTQHIDKSPLTYVKVTRSSGKNPLMDDINSAGSPTQLNMSMNIRVIKAIKDICIQKNERGLVGEKTLTKLAAFYIKYRSDSSFNRDVLAAFFGIKPNSASKIIRKCCDLGIMRHEKRDVYFFVKLDV